MKIEIRLAEQSKLFKNQPEKVVSTFLSLSSEELTSQIKKKTPVDTGKLRGSWTPKLTKDRLVVQNTRNYALFVEKGTGIFATEGRHRIFPKTAQAMHAKIDGEDIFFTNSRGQPGRHMAEDGFMEYRKKIPNLFRTSLIRQSGGKQA
ncbi:HK97 gp10 family phage protein [Methanosphaera sp.]|uniref:HK97 gp10 family phage protein n=1 Tax=Methanosphaera sp. TaxID=2666342 RepID=UPI0025EF6231|nr:HK97 gp10 family phage protein [Methanosphaera sp.]